MNRSTCSSFPSELDGAEEFQPRRARTRRAWSTPARPTRSSSIPRPWAVVSRTTSRTGCLPSPWAARAQADRETPSIPTKMSCWTRPSQQLLKFTLAGKRQRAAPPSAGSGSASARPRSRRRPHDDAAPLAQNDLQLPLPSAPAVCRLRREPPAATRIQGLCKEHTARQASLRGVPAISSANHFVKESGCATKRSTMKSRNTATFLGTCFV